LTSRGDEALSRAYIFGEREPAYFIGERNVESGGDRVGWLEYEEWELKWDGEGGEPILRPGGAWIALKVMIGASIAPAPSNLEDEVGKEKLDVEDVGDVGDVGDVLEGESEIVGVISSKEPFDMIPVGIISNENEFGNVSDKFWGDLNIGEARPRPRPIEGRDIIGDTNVGGVVTLVEDLTYKMAKETHLSINSVSLWSCLGETPCIRRAWSKSRKIWPTWNKTNNNKKKKKKVQRLKKKFENQK
jgi:hypothetical protein